MDLSKLNTVFCDEKLALNWAYKNGLPRNAIIKTSSPTLILDKKINTINLERNWSPKKLIKFQLSIQKTILKIYNKINSLDYFIKSEALNISSILLESMILVYKGSCLKETDLTGPATIIYVKSKHPYDKFLYPEWIDLLDSNKEFQKINAKINIPTNFSPLTAENIKFFDRLYIAGIETIIYIIGKKFGKIIKKLGVSKGHFLIFKSHEMLKEVASNMFLNGYTYEEYIPEKINYPNKINNVPDLGEIDTILDNFLNLWLKPPYIKKCKEILKTRISKSLKHQFLVETAFKQKDILNNIDFIFSGPLSNVYGRSLCSVANKKNIPIIAFHHGVTHEISDTIKINYPLYDANFADFTITHTDLGALAVKDQPYKRASVKAIGLPSRALRLKNFKKVNNQIPMIYISTNLTNGNENIPLVNQENEWDQAIREYNFIKKVLCRLPHNVAFKPYPEDTRKYLDLPITTSLAKKSKNITVVGENFDARFLIKDFNVFITSGATSTLGWLISANRPLVFINWEYHMPLKKDVISELNSALFYFNGNNLNFQNEITQFLSLPIQEIEKLWEKKSKKRKNFMKKYISKNTKKIGSQGYKEIINFLNNFNKNLNHK